MLHGRCKSAKSFLKTRHLSLCDASRTPCCTCTSYKTFSFSCVLLNSHYACPDDLVKVLRFISGSLNYLSSCCGLPSYPVAEFITSIEILTDLLHPIREHLARASVTRSGYKQVHACTRACNYPTIPSFQGS